MTTYVIGDLQGCGQPFEALLDLIQFDARKDQIWLVGDVVNRGPQSLKLLRWVKNAGSAVRMVLGNHDLHLLCVAEGFAELRPGDTLDEILNAPDRDDLLHWLRHQPLAILQDAYLVIHAGLLPQWEIHQILQLTHEIETILQSNDYRYLLQNMYGNEPNHWDEHFSGIERWRVIVNALTRLRVCTAQGEMDLRFKGAVEKIPGGYQPWFAIENAAWKKNGVRILCGHWSALGAMISDSVIALDSGCLWGGSLTAIRLPDHTFFSVPCAAS